jgi:hypothetical protein
LRKPCAIALFNCAFTSLIAHKSYAQLPCSVVISGEKLLGMVGVSTADRAACRLETAVPVPDDHQLFGGFFKSSASAA